MRVASVPAGHPYVLAVTDPATVDLLPDPPVEGAPAGQWWPPRLLDPSWVAGRTDDFDLLHVHFGLESHPPARIAEAIDLVRAAGRPVVFTVHDLENPQLVDQVEHLRALDEMVARADALLTLTDAAAGRIAERWGRTPAVVPHPRLHPAFPESTDQDPDAAPDVVADVAPPRLTRRVGLHLRDLRPNIDGVGAVATLVRAVAELRRRGMPVVAEVHLAERVRDEEAAGRIAELVEGRGGVELARHARLDDDALAAAIARLDALVLPYAWGTHSGWVELAHDAAVPVVGTAVGALAAQHPDDFHAYALHDPDSLARALAEALARPAGRPGPHRAAEVTRRDRARRAEARAVRDAHSALYRDLLADRSAP